jgi:hypothetical protein
MPIHPGTGAMASPSARSPKFQEFLVYAAKDGGYDIEVVDFVSREKVERFREIRSGQGHEVLLASNFGRASSIVAREGRLARLILYDWVVDVGGDGLESCWKKKDGFVLYFALANDDGVFTRSSTAVRNIIEKNKNKDVLEGS